MTWRNTIWQGPWKWLLIAIMLLLIGVAIPMFVVEDNSTTDLVIGVVAIGLSVILMAVMHNWITVEPGQVRFGFVPFYWKTLPYSEIRSVSRVEIQPIGQYGGLGIKGLAKSKRGLLLGGAPPSGLRFETVDDRRYVVTFKHLDPIINALAIHGCTLSAEISD